MPDLSHTSLPELYRSKPVNELWTTTANSFYNKVVNFRTEPISSMMATNRYPGLALWLASQSTANNEAAIIGLSEIHRPNDIKPLPIENVAL
jgi:hypothetical protein